jgi:hypothetical protein
MIMIFTGLFDAIYTLGRRYAFQRDIYIPDDEEVIIPSFDIDPGILQQ